MVEFTKIGTPKVGFCIRPRAYAPSNAPPFQFSSEPGVCPAGTPVDAELGEGAAGHCGQLQVALSMRYVDQKTGRDADAQNELLADEPSLSTGGEPAVPVHHAPPVACVRATRGNPGLVPCHARPPAAHAQPWRCGIASTLAGR